MIDLPVANFPTMAASTNNSFAPDEYFVTNAGADSDNAEIFVWLIQIVVIGSGYIVNK